MTDEHGVHTDPAAIAELVAVAESEHAQVAADGSVAGYRASRTLRLGVELRRQLRRRRTQFAVAFLGVLPFLLLIAFKAAPSSNSGSRSASSAFVDLATSSGLNFAIFALFASASFLLVVVIALFFGDTIASEASWSSLKYLLAIPVPRGRLLRQKAVVSGILSLIGLVVLPAMALVVGLIWYGSGDLISTTGESLPFGTGLARLALAVVYLAVYLVWIAGLALLLSVSTDAPLGAVGGAVLVSIVSQILDSITALGDLRDYLPSHYATAWSDLLSADVDWGDMTRGAFSSLAYGAIFMALAARRFARKDITS
ncbi:ABC transporter permease [Kutzneria buriramensis]|uniref:ABC-2 type transport system permease protein n=1 Tax=Kutzneria buriramensis TaxID=1045776 RepID=A0A3E0HZQ4_9PSEU|nr:ABC transporter permease [Kutzneria buriramensis]REH51800.1 ABC-2 type transport system permease protein [Kutzneria buriramensis]